MTNPSFSQPWSEENRVVRKELEKTRRRTLSPKRTARKSRSQKSPSFHVQNSIVGTRPTHWSKTGKGSHPTLRKKQKRPTNRMMSQHSNNSSMRKIMTTTTPTATTESKPAAMRRGPLSSMLLQARRVAQDSTSSSARTSFTPEFLTNSRGTNHDEDDDADPKEYTIEETKTRAKEEGYEEDEEEPFWFQQQARRKKKKPKHVGPLSQKLAQLRANRTADELRLKSGGVMIHDPRREKHYLDVEIVSPSPQYYHTSTMVWLGKKLSSATDEELKSNQDVWVVVRHGSQSLPSRVRIYNPVLLPKKDESTNDVVIVTQLYEALPEALPRK